ncbi:MFS transporter, MCP family, solute carrier family 16 (monocarboxylic acid transporters), member 13 [Mytilus galloprovincialis]|uniref:MFS transporter, MCP family, solute carrier family 16 (Monocarboxylic acid transporters), member 13 n=1 Tax=Mytilus galloprovincialis TaxID=29158 RepID=A0A8B6BHN2_MYTGA|nr:MFS transporter, MCP family, solute carrier family 16 (monocarboxylic acid transporters), member 13 [Mytilus galloprovincialis]
MTWKRVGIPKRKTVAKEQKKGNIQDEGWAWVVMLASCFGVAMSFAFANTFGIFYTNMTEELGFELTSVTLIGSIHTAISLGGAVLVVPVVERFGERQVLIVSGILQFISCFTSAFLTSFPLLLLCMGIILGFGAVLSLVSCMMATDKYFDKKKTTALTLISLGASFSMIIFSPVTKLLLENYGFHGTMMIFSALMLNTVVCGAVVFPLNTKESKTGVETSHKTQIDILFVKRPSFIMYMITNVLFVAGYYVAIGFLPETGISVGIDMDDISLVFSISGVLQIIGRLTFGFLSYKLPSHITKLWIIFLFAVGLTLLIVPFSTKLYHFIMFGLLNGFFQGGSLIGFNLCLKNLLELKYYGRGLSLALSMQGVGGLIGTPIAAFLQKASGNGDIVYLFAFSIFILSGIILLPFSKPRKETRTDIEIAVSQNNFKVYTRRVEQSKNNEIVYERDMNLFEFNI